jgi:hypothetical protein
MSDKKWATYIAQNSKRATQVTKQFIELVKALGLEGKIEVVCPKVTELQAKYQWLTQLVKKREDCGCDDCIRQVADAITAYESEE